MAFGDKKYSVSSSCSNDSSYGDYIGYNGSLNKRTFGNTARSEQNNNSLSSFNKIAQQSQMAGTNKLKNTVFNYSKGYSESNENNKLFGGPLLFNTFQAAPNRPQKDNHINIQDQKFKVNLL